MTDIVRGAHKNRSWIINMGVLYEGQAENVFIIIYS